ncbi:hypothetical protein ACWDSJ_19990 [Nocardia sp. NPDC003482]
MRGEPVEGLDAEGFIAREGSLERVQPRFEPIVAHARAAIARTFGPERLHSAYLYGSVPRGTAVEGLSDLDLLLAMHAEPTDTDRADATAISTELDAAHPEINGAAILFATTTTLLSDLERHDLGWFVACLCTPLLGDDLATHLPRYRPTTLLARETNGDLHLLLPTWAERRAACRTDAERTRLTRQISRRTVRTGLTLVMPRWGGWTSDLARSADVFAHYYPHRADQMRRAATAARAPHADPPVLDLVIDDLAPWLAAEYAATIGIKTPRM